MVGAAAPLLVLKRRTGGRLTTFEAQLSPAIEAIATLQAGSSLQQAMTILAREMPPPISEEFRRVPREAEMGLSFSDSLDGLMKRVLSADLVIFTSAVSIQQSGATLARILRRSATPSASACASAPRPKGVSPPRDGTRPTSWPASR